MGAEGEAKHLVLAYYLTKCRVCLSTLQTPGGAAVDVVFDEDAEAQQLVADVVGGLPIGFGARLLAKLDLLFDEDVVDYGRADVFGVDQAEAVEQVHEGYAELAAGSGVAGEVDFAHHFEYHREGFGGVEVVVHRGVEGAQVFVLEVGGGAADVDIFGVAPVAVGDSFPAINPLAERRHRELYRAPIMALQVEKAQQLATVLLFQILKGDEVIQRFRHFVAVDHHRARVHPVIRQVRAEARLALGDLVGVVREHQVGAAAVDVDVLAQAIVDHRRAFDVPAWAAAPPRRVPADFGVVGGFPEREIERVLFFFFVLYAPRVAQFVDFLIAQGAVVVSRAHPKVDVARGGDVGGADVEQGLNEADYLGDRLRGLGADVGFGVAEPAFVGEHGFGIELGDGLGRGRFARGFVDDLVVNIGDIADVTQVVAEIAQMARDDIEGDRGATVADVAHVVNRNPANVHFDFLAGWV